MTGGRDMDDRRSEDQQCPVAVTPPGPPAAPDLQAEVRRLRAENATLVRLNRLQGRFVAMASHEFKTPLTSITAYTDALLAHADDPDFDRGPQFLAVIRDESARLLRMVNRILDFSRMEYGSRLLERQPVNLAEHARQMLQALEAQAAGRHPSLALVAEPGRLVAEVDADLVRQVVVNLVGNAVKYTPAGGRIEVTVAEAAAYVTVAVADTGPGIPEGDLRRIFRAFYRAEATTAGETGTGLGLSIVRHIVSLHGGHVDVATRPGGGSVFTFGLPKLVGTTADSAPAPVAHPDVLRALVLALADHAASRTVVLLLTASGGALRPAAWTGIEDEQRMVQLVPAPRSDEPGDGAALAADLGLGPVGMGPWLMAPLGDGRAGWILVGRRVGGRAYAPRDLAQAGVLGRIAAQALRGGADDPGRTVEALRLLLQMRRGGIPTATPETQDLVAALAAALGMDGADTARLQDAAALHDAGMARVDDEILNGESDLDWDARDEVDRHVQLGLDLLAPLLGDPATAAIIRHHHERWDGGGHPDGLAGGAIPLGARALAVIDAWASLTSDRPYRSGLDGGAALREITACAGSQFDPAVVAALAPLVTAPAPIPDRSVPADMAPGV